MLKTVHLFAKILLYFVETRSGIIPMATRACNLRQPHVPTADDGGVSADESRRRKENPFNFKYGCCHRLYDHTKYDISYIYIVY